MKRISLLAIFLLSASAGFGQTVLATVTGTITDQAGAVVPNAPVSVKNLDTGQVYSAATSEAGNYTVPQLPLGMLHMDFWNSFGPLQILSDRWGEPDPPASVSELLNKCDKIRDRAAKRPGESSRVGPGSLSIRSYRAIVQLWFRSQLSEKGI